MLSQFVCMLYVLLLYLHWCLLYLSHYIYIFPTYFSYYLWMYIFLPPHQPHQHPRHALFHFPIICNLCVPMYLTGIISDVFALPAPTPYTHTRTSAYAPYTSAYTRTCIFAISHTRTHPYVGPVLPFSPYLLVPPHIPTYISLHTHPHTPPHTLDGWSLPSASSSILTSVFWPGCVHSMSLGLGHFLPTGFFKKILYAFFVQGRWHPTQSQLIQIYSVDWTDAYNTHNNEHRTEPVSH